jgi:hypothetical protein
VCTLQVWYSSAWSHSTKAAFMTALTTVLDHCSSSEANISLFSSIASTLSELLFDQKQNSSSSSNKAAAATAPDTAAEPAAANVQQSLPKPSRPVLQLLRHWASNHDVSLDASRSSWLSSIKKGVAYIGGLKGQADRLAFTRYIFTGNGVAG